MRWKIFQWMSKLLLRHSSNSRKLGSRQKFHNDLPCVFTAHYASKNADWNQQQLTDFRGILANRNGANHPYCFLSHRRTGIFLPGGGGKPFAQKNHSSCPNFYERVEKKWGPYWNNIGRPGIWRWLDTVLQGSIIPSLSIDYVAINKHLEKLRPQLY